MKVPIGFAILYIICAVIEIAFICSGIIPTGLAIVLIVILIPLNIIWLITENWTYIKILIAFYWLVTILLWVFLYTSSIDTPTNSITDSTTGETYNYSEELFNREEKK